MQWRVFPKCCVFGHRFHRTRVDGRKGNSPIKSCVFERKRIPSTEPNIKGAFVWDQSGIRIIGIMQVSVRLAALPIPEYLDFHSRYSAPRSRIAGIYSRIYSYSRIFPNERALNFRPPSQPCLGSARIKTMEKLAKESFWNEKLSFRLVRIRLTVTYLP